MSLTNPDLQPLTVGLTTTPVPNNPELDVDRRRPGSGSSGGSRDGGDATSRSSHPRSPSRATHNPTGRAILGYISRWGEHRNQERERNTDLEEQISDIRPTSSPVAIESGSGDGIGTADSGGITTRQTQGQSENQPPTPIINQRQGQPQPKTLELPPVLITSPAAGPSNNPATAAASPQPILRYNDTGHYSSLSLRSPHAITYQGKVYPTAMHLFHAMEFMEGYLEAAELIRLIPQTDMMGVFRASSRASDEGKVRTDWRRDPGVYLPAVSVASRFGVNS